MKKTKRGKRKKEKIKKVEKRRIHYRGLVFGLIFLIISFYLIKYALTLPCEVKFAEKMTEEQEMIMGPLLDQLGVMQRINCLVTDFKALFSILIGIAIIFPAVGAIVRSLAE